MAPCPKFVVTCTVTLDNELLNPLQPGVAFLYPLKTSENLKVFWYFQGV